LVHIVIALAAGYAVGRVSGAAGLRTWPPVRAQSVVALAGKLRAVRDLLRDHAAVPLIIEGCSRSVPGRPAMMVAAHRC